MRRGAVLVAVLVLVAMAGMVAAGLLFRMHATVAASAAIGNGEQAYLAAMSGIQRAMDVLQTSAASEAAWSDNPDLFRNQLVCDDGASRWYFTIYAPGDAGGQQRYGLVRESDKTNINIAAKTRLLALGLTDEQADCLIDYRDRVPGGPEVTEPNGAEQDYYDRLPYPYLIPNFWFTTLEELLLVKGFNAAIVYGEDTNFNGLLEPNEDDGDDSFPPDDRDGSLNVGLRNRATVYGPNTFRVQCIGFGVPCGRIRVLEAVIDASAAPRILYLRDITRLGVPVSLDVESQEKTAG